VTRQVPSPPELPQLNEPEWQLHLEELGTSLQSESFIQVSEGKQVVPFAQCSVAKQSSEVLQVQSRTQFGASQVKCGGQSAGKSQVPMTAHWPVALQ